MFTLSLPQIRLIELHPQQQADSSESGQGVSQTCIHSNRLTPVKAAKVFLRLDAILPANNTSNTIELYR